MKMQIIVLGGLVVALIIFGGVQFSSAAQWKHTANTWRTAAEKFCTATVVWENTYGLETEQSKCDFSSP